jgi:hypothetical protein
VRSVASKSQDGTTEIRHSVDLKAPALTETSMKPFLDNNHLDKTHHLRVQFQGAHSLKITKLESNKKPERYQCPPIYTFFNDKGSILPGKVITVLTDRQITWNFSSTYSTRKFASARTLNQSSLLKKMRCNVVLGQYGSCSTCLVAHDIFSILGIRRTRSLASWSGQVSRSFFSFLN